MVSLKNKKLKIAVTPFDSNFPNKYIDRMIEALKYVYPNAEITPIPRIKDILTLKNHDYAWLNWFESIPKKHKIKNFCGRIIILFALRLLGIKIVATFHNRQPHESTNIIVDKILFNLTFRFSKKIIILSSDSRPILEEKFGKYILQKAVLIPHPTYKCIPKAVSNTKSNFSILFFGNLRPYKNIELIFELAKLFNDIPFTIAGAPIDKKYGEQLTKQAIALSNVTLIPHYLSSKEIDELINKNSILLLPYDMNSSLNSGVVIHAICKRINMIVPAIGTVNQLENHDLIYSYSYKSKEDHFNELYRIIEIVKNEYLNNREKFEYRINTLYKEVTSTQSPEILSQKMKDVFII